MRVEQGASRNIFSAVLFLAVTVVTAAPWIATQAGADEEAVRRGAKTFARSCAACHGRQGRGDGPAAADLDPAPRDLTTRQFRFRSSESGSLPRPEDLERTIRDGLPGSAMPAFGKLFSAAETSDLIDFLYSLQPATDRSVPDALTITPVAPASASTIEQGRQLYRVLGCGSCHGENGSGRGPAAATLTDGGGRKIRTTDFRHDPLKGGSEPEAIVRTLRTGLNGAPMPSYEGATVFAREDLTEIDGLSDEFIRSVPSRTDLDAMSEAARIELRDERLGALAHYLLSLSRRHKVLSRLFHQEPEFEVRVTREVVEPDEGWEGWEE